MTKKVRSRLREITPDARDSQDVESLNLASISFDMPVHGVPCGRRLGLVDLDCFIVCQTLPRQLVLRAFDRKVLAAGQNGATLKSKSTKPRSMTRWDTLY